MHPNFAGGRISLFLGSLIVILIPVLPSEKRTKITSRIKIKKKNV